MTDDVQMEIEITGEPDPDAGSLYRRLLRLARENGETHAEVLVDGELRRVAIEDLLEGRVRPELMLASDETHVFDRDELERKHAALPDRARARASDPETSHEAAASIDTSTLRDSQWNVLRVFQAQVAGFHDERLVDVCETLFTEDVWNVAPQSPSGIRSRRSELVKAGLLEDSGDRVELASGRRSIVWRLTDAGRAATRESSAASPGSE